MHPPDVWAAERALEEGSILGRHAQLIADPQLFHGGCGGCCRQDRHLALSGGHEGSQLAVAIHAETLPI